MTSQETRVLNLLRSKYPNMPIVSFQCDSIEDYKYFVTTNKGVGFIALFPPYEYEGKTYYNDFAVHPPNGKSFAIECKERNRDEINLHMIVKRTKQVIEKSMIFILEGAAFAQHYKQEQIRRFSNTNTVILFDLNLL